MRVFLLLLASVPLCVGGTLVQDSNLNLGGFTVFHYATSGVTQTVSNTAVGNPANGLLVTEVIAPGPQTSVYAFINPAWVYNPAAAGALAQVSASLDVRVDVAVGELFASGWTLWMQQGANLYFYDLGAPGVKGVFQTIPATGLQATHFALFNFSTGAVTPGAHPDFGKSLTFGFGSYNEYNFLGTGTDRLDFYYDNLVISVSSVPEPATAGLAVMALGAIVLAKRRARRRAPMPGA